MKKWVKWSVAAAAMSAFLVGCSGEKEQVVATVDGENITETELNKVLQSQYGPEVLDTLISYKIVEKEAKKLDVTVSDEEIDEEFQVYVEQYGDEESLKKSIAEFNLTVDDIKEDIRIYLLTVKVLEDYVKVTDDDVKAYFEENKESFGTEEQVEASHIVVEEEALAKKLIARLEKGEDFATLAREYSIEEGAKETGGALGTFGRGMMDAAFEEAAFAMKDGELSKTPVKTEFGYHVIKVIRHTAAKEAVYETSKELAREQLLEQKVNDEYETWLEEKKESYEIKKSLFQ